MQLDYRQEKFTKVRVSGIVCHKNRAALISGCILYRDTYNNPCAGCGMGIIILGGFENE